MSSSGTATPPTDLWLERSRLNGMLLSGVSYGMFSILTFQAFRTLVRKPVDHSTKIADQQRVLLAYISITFVLATIGFAGNAKYTQMIWIDLRDTNGGPAALIEDELDFWINRLALACYYVMEWFMEALLLHRCFIIWNWRFPVVAFMSTLFVAYISMSILVMTESKGAVFYNLNVQLAYLCLSVGTNIIYTLLVTGRLLAMRNQIKAVLGPEHSATYTSIAAMIVESAALYSVLGIIFIASFAVHSNISNLIFLSISQVQGIAQLLIILRVAQGRAFSQDLASRTTSTSLAFNTVPGRATSVHMSNLQSGHTSSNTDSVKIYNVDPSNHRQRTPTPTIDIPVTTSLEEV